MDLSIGSFSFHRLLESGQQDMFRYIQDCKALGATLLDPWNAHLAGVENAETIRAKGTDLRNAEIPERDLEYLKQVKAASEAAGMPFGCMAVDGTHIWEPTEEGVRANRIVAYRWLNIGKFLGTRQMRIDAGGRRDTPEMTEEMFRTMTAGFADLIERGKGSGIEILFENHWGVSRVPENTLQLLRAVPGLGLLLDSNNWAPPERREEAWAMTASYARCTHVKTYSFDAQGNDPSVNIPKFIQLCVEAGYRGSWGVESMPKDGDEIEGVRRTFALIKRELGKLGVK